MLLSIPPCVPYSPPDHTVRKKSPPATAIPPRRCTPHARLRELPVPEPRDSHQTHDAAPPFRLLRPNETNTLRPAVQRLPPAASGDNDCREPRPASLMPDAGPPCVPRIPEPQPEQ